MTENVSKDILWKLVFLLLGYSATESLLLSWILLVGFIALVMMGVDKVGARMHRRRIRESTFGMVSLAGGFFGVILGGVIFQHKIAKPSFWTPVLISLLLWSLLFATVFNIIHL